jgi:hypothetical protein
VVDSQRWTATLTVVALFAGDAGRRRFVVFAAGANIRIGYPAPGAMLPIWVMAETSRPKIRVELKTFIFGGARLTGLWSRHRARRHRRRRGQRDIERCRLNLRCASADLWVLPPRPQRHQRRAFAQRQSGRTDDQRRVDGSRPHGAFMPV